MQLSPLPPSPYMPVIIPQDAPAYRLSGPCFLDDEFYPEGAIITFEEEPNPAMEPLNEMALARVREYLKKLDDYGRAVAVKLGKPWNSMSESFENARQLAHQELGGSRLLNGTKTVPLLSDRRKAPRKAKKIEGERAPIAIAAGKRSANTAKGLNAAVADKGLSEDV